MPPTSQSLAGRAALAVGLTIGFYVLALGMIGLLLYLPYAEMQYANRLHLKLALLCVVVAGTIAWSILPRRDKFEAPGLRLERDQQPDLFRELEDVAQRTGQPMPAEVYLVPDANAFVAERGGVLGWGSRRVMGLGLPVLQTLTVSQLRAVVAHEFGHFSSGDTRLGPWLYKVRAAMIRTVVSLGDSWLQAPFRWYAKLFLRITHAVSRRQELVADRVAADAVGAQPLMDGLRVIHGVAPAFQAFWDSEMVPVLGYGYRPPLVQGLSLFMQAESVQAAMKQSVEASLQERETSPYDTHPSLPERLASLAALPPGPVLADDPPAASRLHQVAELESRLLAHMFGPDTAGEWKPVDWTEVGRKVYAPFWKQTLLQYAAGLKGLTAASVPAFLQQPPGELLAQLRKGMDRPLSDEERKFGLLNVVGRALAVAMDEAGWDIDAAPGAPVALHRAELVFKPFMFIAHLYEGKLSTADWQRVCGEAGIASLPLDGGSAPAGVA